ncbi:MAG: IS21-like element helper ATPase IstB [Nitrososphaerota archaeon]
MSVSQQLAPALKQLRLSGILETLEVRNQQAIGEQWTYLEFLTRLAQDEVERRAHKQLDLRVRRGGIATTKTLETFDFSFNPTISRQQLYDLATCAFVRERRNVLICGQTGVGKSHLAQALAHEAARQGFDILFTSAHQMLQSLHAARADGSVDRRLASYLKPQVLVLDDFGLKPLPPSGPVDLYDVVDGRYERDSIIVTSNRAPSEWPELFGDPLLASAALDRLIHRAAVVLISGRSYRLATHRAAGDSDITDDGKEGSLTRPTSA